MALVTGDPVVSSPEKPSLPRLYIYIYVYIHIYTSTRLSSDVSHYQRTVNSPNDGSSGEFGGTGDKFLARRNSSLLPRHIAHPSLSTSFLFLPLAGSIAFDAINFSISP